MSSSPSSFVTSVAKIRLLKSSVMKSNNKMTFKVSSPNKRFTKTRNSIIKKNEFKIVVYKTLPVFEKRRYVDPRDTSDLIFLINHFDWYVDLGRVSVWSLVNFETNVW